MTKERFGETKVHIESMTKTELENMVQYGMDKIEDGDRMATTAMQELIRRDEYPII